MDSSFDPKFPCAIELHVPLPSSRLASTALKALQVDPELSSLVRRQMAVVEVPRATASESSQVLKVDYQATTNRMLRVAVNSFMESLKLVLEVMEQLDVDVLAIEHNQKSSTDT